METTGLIDPPEIPPAIVMLTTRDMPMIRQFKMPSRAPSHLAIAITALTKKKVIIVSTHTTYQK